MGVRSGWRRAVVAGSGMVLAVGGVGGCGSAEAGDAPVERKTFAFGGQALEIDAGNTDIELVTGDVQGVEVARQVDGWVFMGSGPETVWQLEGGRLTLEVSCEAMASSCDSRHRVTVPSGVGVTVTDDNGSVSASGFSSALSLRADNGEVVVRNSSGALELTSENGAVRAEGVSSRQVTAAADNGSVTLSLTAAPDRVEAVSDNGEIVVELPPSKGPYAVSADADNGTADVDVPTDPGSAHVVSARSENGEVTVRSAN
ncbi:DUF4097 family beta strand repeat-containing protein [Streptomyces sp. HNM0663]|uniref:DUF4097 family beta strand repeat-containing protein n=1 Tax=Streptomyces chengmaiensis TaxID=3040919 RepID=A0ABT6HKT3_9ACTN|nr:DUF4097 family beta strand repeat-containing protein [Streptomyces chengmaiensis]